MLHITAFTRSGDSVHIGIQKFDEEKQLLIGFVDDKRVVYARSNLLLPPVDNLPYARHVAGPLSTPSKMPGYAYGLPAQRCKAGGKLQKAPGTVCSRCYALRGRYVFPKVRSAQERRFQALEHPQWVEAMVFQIQDAAQLYFRWHDSGDIQSGNHLFKICKIARALPETHFWLPTKERGLVTQYVRMYGPESIPSNLVIRLSATRIDEAPQSVPHPVRTATVVRDKTQASCPARYQNNRCELCRACWQPDVPNVSYPLH